MVSAEAAREAGGYDASLEHGEDAEFGRRLAGKGSKVIFDPGLTYWQTGTNSVGKVLERYWRWNRAHGRNDNSRLTSSRSNSRLRRWRGKT